jgi:membrane protease YdiL (CAAX protease family)
MKMLTLTPDLRYYYGLVLILASLSSFALSEQLCQHFSILSFKYIIEVNAIVKFFIALFGFTIIPVHAVFCWNISNILLSLSLGVAAGCFIFSVEKWFVSKKFVFVEEKALEKNKVTFTPPFHKKSPNRCKSSSVLVLILVALFEEIIFRGFIIAVALSLVEYYQSIALIILSIIVFSFSHRSEGNRNIILKGFSAILLSVMTLLLHSITAAILAHIILNVRIFLYNKNDYILGL